MEINHMFCLYNLILNIVHTKCSVAEIEQCTNISCLFESLQFTESFQHWRCTWQFNVTVSNMSIEAFQAVENICLYTAEFEVQSSSFNSTDSKPTLSFIIHQQEITHLREMD